MDDNHASEPPVKAARGQAITTGLLASFVGFGGSFAVVVQGLAGVGASPEQTASGLLVLSVGMGLLGIILIATLSAPMKGAFSILVTLVMIAVGYVTMRLLVFDMIDQVFDDGDALILKNRGKEERVALSDVQNVRYSAMISPPRVVLSLGRPTIFGTRVAFCAPISMMPFQKSEAITDLIARVESARRA